MEIKELLEAFAAWLEEREITDVEIQEKAGDDGDFSAIFFPVEEDPGYLPYEICAILRLFDGQLSGVSPIFVVDRPGQFLSTGGVDQLSHGTNLILPKSYNTLPATKTANIFRFASNRNPVSDNFPKSRNMFRCSTTTSS